MAEIVVMGGGLCGMASAHLVGDPLRVRGRRSHPAL